MIRVWFGNWERKVLARLFEDRHRQRWYRTVADDDEGLSVYLASGEIVCRRIWDILGWAAARELVSLRPPDERVQF
jgi:hypothetical protein